MRAAGHGQTRGSAPTGLARRSGDRARRDAGAACLAPTSRVPRADDGARPYNVAPGQKMRPLPHAPPHAGEGDGGWGPLVAPPCGNRPPPPAVRGTGIGGVRGPHPAAGSVKKSSKRRTVDSRSAGSMVSKGECE